jgi:hypothetical protein
MDTNIVSAITTASNLASQYGIIVPGVVRYDRTVAWSSHDQAQCVFVAASKYSSRREFLSLFITVTSKWTSKVLRQERSDVCRLLTRRLRTFYAECNGASACKCFSA